MKKFIIVTIIISIAFCLCSCDPYADEREEANKRIKGLEDCAKGEHAYVDLTEDHIHDYCYYRECKWCKDVQSMTHSYIRQSDSTRTQHHLKCAECDHELTEDHIGRGEDTTEVIDRTKQTMMVFGRVYAKGSYYHLDITDIPHIIEETDGTCEGCNWAISHYEVSSVSTYELDAYGRPARKCTVNGMNAIRLTHPSHDFIECDIKNIYIADCEIKLEENYTFNIAILYVETTGGWYTGSGTAVDPPTVVLGDAFLQ